MVLVVAFNITVVPLGEKLANVGLPQFVQSYLVPTITVEGLCHGNQSQFRLNSSIVPLMVNWDFGDGGTSSDVCPIHQYISPGEYQVTVTITTVIGGTISKSKSITIIAEPVANSIPTQHLCGGTGQNLNLTQFNNLILGTQSSLNFGIVYFSSLINAQNHIDFLPNNVSLTLGNNFFT